jgi:N6-adenosine-specific RNA methylase IME4
MAISRKYKVIYADPPWRYGRSWDTPSDRTHGKSYPMPYPEMTLGEIKQLPVQSLAADDCELYLWTTQKYLPHAFGVMNAWGFRYCQTLTWCKTPRGTGQGGVYCPTTEFLLLGRRGRMPNVKRVDSTWFHTKRPHNRHSKKPEFFHELIESVSHGPRVELFARDRREGWDVWGNEVKSDIRLEPLPRGRLSGAMK